MVDHQGSRGGNGVPRHRRRRRAGGVRALVGLLAVCVAAASVLAWQLLSARPAHAHRTPPTSTTHLGDPSSSSSSSSSTTSTTPTTTSGPLRVLEIGDSLGVDLGEAMQSAWPSSSVQLTVAAKGDTGLSNSGYYNWPTVLQGLLASTDPQVVVVFLGANDLQGIVTGGSVFADGTPAWNTAYAKRVTEVISESARAGAKVLWIGMPAMQDPFINAGMTRLDGIDQSVVARHPRDAVYLSANTVLAPDGTFSFDATGLTGQQVQVRTPDGVHLMPAGASLLASAAAQAMAAAWGMTVAGQ